jgi:oligopeptide/dipeptide ABC transporter ATP-binding protein
LASPVADPVAQDARRPEAARGAQAAPPEVRDIGEGCPFVARCPFAVATCASERPVLRPVGHGVSVACHRYPEWQAEVPAPYIDAKKV